MKDFIEFFQTIGERLRSRVFGPFILSFLFWNWKPILLILLSNCPIEDTIGQIEVYNMFSLENVFLIPFGISLAYSLILPFLSLGLGLLIIWPQGKSIESNYKLKGKRRKEDVKIAKLDYEYETAKAGKLELEDLNNKVTNLQNSNERYVKENEDMRNKLTKILPIEEEYNILKEENIRQKNSIKEATEMILSNDHEHLSVSMDLVNSELQKGNFKLLGIPNSFIQNLLDHEMIKIEKINGQDYLNFSDKGRLGFHYSIKEK